MLRNVLKVMALLSVLGCGLEENETDIGMVVHVEAAPPKARVRVVLLPPTCVDPEVLPPEKDSCDAQE